MKSKMPLVVVGVVVIAVGIYMYTQSPQSAAPQPNTGATPAPSAGSVPKTPTAGTTVSTSSSLPAIDDTWKTYTSKSLGITFMWPTKGRNAPTWEVSTSDTDCAGPGGPTAGPTMVELNGRTFCHSKLTDGAAGSMYLTDTYTTKNGSKYVVITFTKKVTNAGALDCPFVAEHNYSTSATTCIPFIESDYYAHLDQIVSTYTVTE